MQRMTEKKREQERKGDHHPVASGRPCLSFPPTLCPAACRCFHNFSCQYLCNGVLSETCWEGWWAFAGRGRVCGMLRPTRAKSLPNVFTLVLLPCCQNEREHSSACLCAHYSRGFVASLLSVCVGFLMRLYQFVITARFFRCANICTLQQLSWKPVSHLTRRSDYN